MRVHPTGSEYRILGSLDPTPLDGQTWTACLIGFDRTMGSLRAAEGPPNVDS